ncbi:hypothetical protein BDW59DRAFT_157592 [Aspergillus cavernicola]|uniref:Integral membrane protein n=1 Tax=Aspergillus cavernicola TaxID=176166 RepID=A0ABR4IWL0_9EURO
MSRNNRDEHPLEGNTDAHDACRGSEDDHNLTALQEKAQTRSKPRRYRRMFSKMAAAAVLSAGEEILASWLAKDRGKNGRFYTSRVPKQAIYGSLIHTPINHWLLKAARYLFRGRTGQTSRFLAILFGLLVVAPVQKIMFFAAGAIIAGARTFDQVRATVRAALLPVMKVLLLMYPIAVAFALNFLPEIAWPRFFDIVNSGINVYGNTHVKKKRIEALRRRYLGNPVIKKEESDESDVGSIAVPAALPPTNPPIPRANLGAGTSPRLYRVRSDSSDSDADENETESDASPIRIPFHSRSYYAANRSGGSIAGRDGVGSDTSQPGATAAYTTDTWDPLYTLDILNYLDREEMERGSEIDSDTSSDLPTPRLRYSRR